MQQTILERLGIRHKSLNRTFVPTGTRTIQIYTNNKMLHNSVSTAKYSALTLLPRFLYEFFSLYANLFFLLVSFLQSEIVIKGISPTSRVATAVPLAIILLLTLAKELWEDAKRHSNDYRVNNQLVKVVKDGKLKKQRWKQVKVGDVVRVENSESFPADLIILSSSEPDGLCYIETANLDGETNLKIKQALPETSDILNLENLAKLQAQVKSELPNNSLYTFEALLMIKGQELSVGPQQLLLRGAQLKNTRWVYGIIVFTGHETKLMMNSSTTPIKTTKVQRMVNTQIIVLFFVLLLISILGAIGQSWAEHFSPFNSQILLTKGENPILDFCKNVLTYIILFNNLIPLSLLVTVEFVRLVIGKLINYDLDMYYAVNDTPATAHTSSLVEELGQIDYIFSDKTGTLTRNIMEFKMASIGTLSYCDKNQDSLLGDSHVNHD